MKLILVLFTLLNLNTGFAQTSEEVEIKLENVVQKVSQENFSVYESALRIYQAKESITVARMNLLPRLNLWKFASAAFEIFTGGMSGQGSGALSLVEDIAPFLVPANWFRVRQSQLFLQADLEGYRALWSNEVLTAKSLYFHLLLDNNLVNSIEQSREELQAIYKIVKVRETFGGIPPTVSQDIKLRMLALEEDARAMKVLIAEEESLLAYMMGFTTGVRLKALPVEMPDYDNLEELNYEDFIFRAVDTSPEIKQFGFLITAADYVRSEIRYSFLGSSSLSRGLSGGVFDALPVQSGLGFGTAASMRIVSTQKEILKTQKKAVEETVKRHLKLLVNNYNLDIQNYRNLKLRSELARLSLKQLYQRVKLGQDVEVLTLIESSKNTIEADTALYGVMFRFLSTEDKLSRIIFYGDYENMPEETGKPEEEE